MDMSWSSRAKVRRTALVLASTTSLVLHGLALIWIQGLATLPAIDFELTKPDSAEFGVAEAEPHAPPPPPAQPETSAPPSEPVAPQPPASAPPAPPKPKPAPPPAPTVAAEAGAVGHFAPKGAQVALRLDVERVRATPLSDDVTGLLNALPDVRALLEGSGIEPMRDLTRLFLASPDLRREHVVMAGQYQGDDSVPRAAVAQLAQQRGQPAEWQTKRGIRIAPWLNVDPTPRVVALIGPNLFAITRDEDLARVLAVARTLNQRSRSDATPADALVKMAEGEWMNVSVENVRNFVRARGQVVPLRLEASVRGADERVHLDIEAQYADEEQGRAALQYWAQLRDRYAQHPLLSLIGMDNLLRAARLEQQTTTLKAQLLVPFSQAQLLLRWLRDSFQRSPTSGPALGTARTP